MKFRQLFISLVLCPFVLYAAKYNAYGLKFYTIETDHFRISYMDGCGHLVKTVGCKFEELYSIYRNTYGITLPKKTDVFILDGDQSNGWALPNTNSIVLWPYDIDFNMRGSHDWFEDLIAHEYGHIVSISSGLKMPPQIPQIRFGYFSHPNEKNRAEAIHHLPTEILPPWLTEGIAQYESTRHGADSWDSHRDMILRSLALSGKLLSWDHMQVFTGKGDDYEKTYDHGFALVKYIAETYGYDKVSAMLRASSKITRLNFDHSIKEVLGISGKELYTQWKRTLETQYSDQIKKIGTQVYGKKINKDGYENVWPRFSGDGKNIFFLSNGKADYGMKFLYKYSLSDTVKDENKIKLVKRIGRPYDIHYSSGRICFTSSKSKKSVLPSESGGTSVRDLFIDSISTDEQKFQFFPKKMEKQVTIRKNIFTASFSPAGNMLACAQRNVDKFKLVLVDTAGKSVRPIYPADGAKNDLTYIYTIDWAPNGSQIAFSYFDVHDRKIAIYDTLKKSCEVICNTDNDERDPQFSPDSKYLYFSSDRTGIFNIYRYEFSSGKLEQITNVSGGAFMPSISPDNKQLVYAGYEKDGYGIFYIDKITPVKETSTSPAITQKGFSELPLCSLSLSNPRKYSRVPHQFLLVPTFFAEQLVSSQSNVNKGVTTYKTGFIFNLFEPLTFSAIGNEIGGYFLVEPKYLINFLDFSRGGFNPDASYDLGVFGNTNVLPLSLSADYSIRGIAGTDTFYNESEDMEQALPYNIQQQNLNLRLTHNFGEHTEHGLAIHLLTGGNLAKVNLLLDNTFDFKYTLDQGFRFGTMGTYGTIAPNAHSTISPEGTVAKLQYTFNTQFALKDENSFNNKNQERFDKYEYHEVRGHLKTGMPSPWYAKHDLHLELNGAAVKTTGKDDFLPSYLLPAAWLPGYSYYYRSIKTKSASYNKYAQVSYDTLVITGNAVLNGEISYRFPLWPKLIDKRISFLYLERLYGAINVSGGAGFSKSSDFFDFNREDWLVSYGCELRLETKSFYSFPLALRVRYDKGIDKDAPIGGSRFTFSVGYDFDNWDMVLQPDYRNQLKR